MQVLSGMNEMLGCLVRVTLLGLMLTSQMGRHPIPSFPLFQPRASLEPKSRRCRGTVPVLAHPGLCQRPGKQAQEVAVLSDPRSLAPAGLRAAFSAPLPPGPSGASVAAAVELRRGDRLPLCGPGKQRRGRAVRRK